MFFGGTKAPPYSVRYISCVAVDFVETVLLRTADNVREANLASLPLANVGRTVPTDIE